MDASRRTRSDVAPDTLLVASVGSATATVVIGRFGLAGTLLGAALFPVVVALSKELARRPAGRIPTSVRVRGRAREDTPAGGEGRGVRRPLGERLRDVRWKRVLATSAVAFAVVVAAFTLAELAFGGSLVSDRPTTFFSPGEEPGAPPPGDPGAPAPEEPPPEPAPEEPPAEGLP